MGCSAGWSLHGFFSWVFSPPPNRASHVNGSSASSSRVTGGSWLAAVPAFLGYSHATVLVRLTRSVVAPSLCLFGSPSGSYHIYTLLRIGHVGKASRNPRVRPTEGAWSAAG